LSFESVCFSGYFAGSEIEPLQLWDVTARNLAVLAECQEIQHFSLSGHCKYRPGSRLEFRRIYE